MSRGEMKITCTDSGREEQLQFLRFLAFLNVYIVHAEAWLFFQYPASHCGTAAVSFFFMLSGLVTGLAYCGKDVRLGLRDYGGYLWRKIKKIYPLYFFTVMYTFLYADCRSLTALADLSSFPRQLVRNLLLLQSWFSEGYFSYNGVGWFLSTLVFLWACSLPVMALLNQINRRPKGWMLLLGGLGAVLFLTAVCCYLTKNLDMDYWQYVFPPARLGEYLSGMLLGMLIHSLKPCLKPGKGMRLLFTALEIGVLYYWFAMLSHSGGSWRSRIFTWLLPNVCLLSVFTCGMGWISSLFRRKPLVCLGDVSFECYLLHYVIVMQYTLFHLDQELSGVGKPVVFLYCLGLTLLLAFLIHRWPGRKQSSDSAV